MKQFKSYYIFNVLALGIVIFGYFVYVNFQDVSKNILNTYNSTTKDYVQSFVDNLEDVIVKDTNNDIYKTLKQNPKLIKMLEEHLSLFVTNRYKYIYLLTKDTKKDRYFFLLDGTKNLDDKSEFEEEYQPSNLAYYKKVYKTKKPIFFQEKKVEGLWMTYIKPIVVENKIEALLVVDFSVEEFNIVKKALNSFSDFSQLFAVFLVGVFIIIIRFSMIDNKRGKEMELFNHKLELKVKEEVEKNRKKDQQIIQQSRLAQMGEMISMIAHQWRQPLAAISSTSAGIKLKAQLNKLDNDLAIELSSKISNYSQHLSLTIDDFREFFKDNKEKADTNYTTLIHSVLDIIEVAIENKNIKIVKNLNSTSTFYTYPNEIKQVILNLIKNAEDILIDNEIQDATITITTYDNILTVSDNAGGVPDDIIDKIFDPYFSTKTKKDGTGLGLYMSKTIIEEHCGGKLTVVNNEKGAVFKIDLGDING